jgi:hypothetical protein
MQAACELEHPDPYLDRVAASKGHSYPPPTSIAPSSPTLSPSPSREQSHPTASATRKMSRQQQSTLLPSHTSHPESSQSPCHYGACSSSPPTSSRAPAHSSLGPHPSPVTLPRDSIKPLQDPEAPPPPSSQSNDTATPSSTLDGTPHTDIHPDQSLNPAAAAHYLSHRPSEKTLRPRRLRLKANKLKSKLAELRIRHASMTLVNSGSVARDHLASERTFLAYVRTSLAISSLGVG